MKYKLAMSALVAVSLLAACNNSDTSTKDSNTKTETTQNSATNEEKATTEVAGVTLKEPAKDEVCAFCNMKVYQKTTDLGAFTAQAVDEKGKNLFFDDAGCMLNYEREHNVTLDKYVRNYDDKEWMKLDDAIVVEGDFKTPMKYGFAYFKDMKSANAFIEKNKGAEVTDVSEINDDAHERYEKMNGTEKMDDMDMDDKDDMDNEKSEHDSHE
ncbi:MAG: nitrous oxide reductase accessory protein NosL [Kurthia sp.]|nr:nitrous oxide reductase accessory protein NosL [Candidatus Kurthia equi]